LLEKTGYLTINCNIKNSEITAIRHPISKQIIKYQANYKLEKKSSQDNFRKIPLRRLRKGQSMSQLAQAVQGPQPSEDTDRSTSRLINKFTINITPRHWSEP